MALVKKLQLGGSADPAKDTFNAELDKQIGSYKLRSKDERKVRETLTKMRDYLADPTGKSFSVDPVSQKYTITGPGSEKFAGSPDEIHQGWLSGNLKIKDDQDVMSVAAAIYNKALQSTKSASATPVGEKPIAKEKRSILDLPEFAVTKNAYGTEENYEDIKSKAKTDPERQKIVYDLSKKAIDAYLDEYENKGGKNNFEYEDYQDVLKMKKVLENPNLNWDEYSQQAYKLKWTPSSFLIPKTEGEAAPVTPEVVAPATPEVAKGPSAAMTPSVQYVPMKPKKEEDLTGTWKGQTTTENALDTLSMAGTVASFIPGVGAIGAGTAMGADIAKDLQDGKIDNWGAHALNLGFVGLSLIGLGGLKALVKGAQVAKKTTDIGKLSTKATKLGANVLKTTEKESLKKVVALSEKLGVKTTEELAEKVAKLAPKEAGSAKKILEEGAMVLGTIQKASRPVLGSTTLGVAAKKAPDVLNKVVSGLNSKPIRTGLRMAVIAPAIPAAAETVKTGFTKGWEYTKPEDISRVVTAGVVGKRWFNDKKIVRAINRQTTPISEEIKPVEAVSEVAKKSKLGILGKIIPKKLKDFKVKKKVASSLILGEQPLSTTGNRSIDVRDYELAKKHLGKVGINPTPVKETKPVKEVKKKTPLKKKSTHKVSTKKEGLEKKEYSTKYQSGGSLAVKAKKEKSTKAYKSGFLNYLDKNVDLTDVANVAMAASTMSANKKAGTAQKKAALAGIVQTPLAQKEYIRTGSPMSLQTEKQAAETRSQVRRIGSSTSDLNRAVGALLQGNAQANDIITKGQLYDQQANAKVGEMQRASDARTNAYNLEAITRNRSSIANAEKSLHLIDSNQAIAQNAVRTNLITGLEKNVLRKDYLKKSEEIQELSNNPEYVKLREEYDKLISPETQKAEEDTYNTNREKLGASKSTGTWLESAEYANYKMRIKQAEERLKPMIDMFKQKKLDLTTASNRMYLRKSGGTLSKEDRIDIERAKARLRSSEKDIELTYKAIMHNNEMLQKALIKIFK